MPAPDIAVKYYTGGDLYLFGEFVFPGIINILQSCRDVFTYDQQSFKLALYCLQMSSKHQELPILEDQ